MKKVSNLIILISILMISTAFKSEHHSPNAEFVGRLAFPSVHSLPFLKSVGEGGNKYQLNSVSTKYQTVTAIKDKIPKVYVDERALFMKLVIVLLTALIVSVVFVYKGFRKAYLLARKSNKLENQVQEKSQHIQELITEKEWLITEIHHRVKNNLQIIISLLNSQSTYLSSPEAIHAIKNSQHRMYAISLVHQKLYQAENLSRINMECYISALLQYLQDEYASAQRVKVMLQTIPMDLEVNLAIPLALIINEAVSNSFQYAFPHLLKGELNLKLEIEDEDHYLLQISDNGVGLPVEYDSETKRSFGTILMTGLSQQLHADLEIKNMNGVNITLRIDRRILKAS